MIQVKDGQRILQFEGTHLGSSSSYRAGVSRWVTFDLYKTDEAGKYVLSRQGFSMFYHDPSCEIAERNMLPESPASEITPGHVPCEECHPEYANFPFVCFEQTKTWARVCPTPGDVMNGLLKTNKSGTPYMTAVARRVLDAAVLVDDALAEAYQIETIL